MLSRAECRPGLASVSATCGGREPGSAGSGAALPAPDRRTPWSRTGDGADRCSPIGAGPTSGTRPPGGFGRDSVPADAAAPETSDPGPSGPGACTPGLSRPEACTPGPSGPGASGPGASVPGASGPEASGPEASAPGPSGPEASGPEASGGGAGGPGGGMSAGSGPAAGRSGARGPAARGGGQTAVPGGSRSTGGSSASDGERSASGGVTGRDTPGSVSPGRRRGPVGRSGASADSSGVGSQPPTRIPVRAMSSSATDPPRPPAASGPAPWLAVGRMTQNAILEKAISPRNSHAPHPAKPSPKLDLGRIRPP